MGWIVTILIGVASLVIAGLIFSSGWLQFIVGVVIAVILVWFVGTLHGLARGAGDGSLDALDAEGLAAARRIGAPP